MSEDPDAIRVQRLVHHKARELYVYLSQQDGRPLTHDLIRMIREYGTRCYLEGMAQARSERWADDATSPTLPAPPMAAAKTQRDSTP